jgi:hypothetical protein
MKKFIIRLFIFLLPLLILISVYIFTDPFKVIYHYDSYYQSGKPVYVSLNRDYVSVETFRNNYPQYRYDSYILGNSRSLAYRVSDWQTHINSHSCYHFDASNEGLFGVEKKLDYLQRMRAPIKNVLILLDNDLLKQTNNSEGTLYIKHPLLSGENTLAFHFEFLKTYFNPDFLKAYVDFLLSHKVKEYMKQDKILDDRPVTYNIANNELRMDSYEKIINSNAQEYYKPLLNSFYKRDSVEHQSPVVIKEAQVQLLQKMKFILDKEQTDYRIIINPLYDQMKFNSEDLQKLQEIFGAKHVFDFSGKNAITDNMYNYYEVYHYRPCAANVIMDSIYKQHFNSNLSDIVHSYNQKGIRD